MTEFEASLSYIAKFFLINKQTKAAHNYNKSTGAVGAGGPSMDSKTA